MTFKETLDSIDDALKDTIMEWYEALSQQCQHHISQFDLIMLSMVIQNNLIEMEDEIKAKAVQEYIAEGDTDTEACDV